MEIANAVERRIGEKNTRAFIAAHPSTVALRRPRTQPTAALGKRRADPDTIAAQDFRIVPMSGLVWDRSRGTADEGRIDDVTEQLICMPNADIQMDDYFPSDEGGWWVVTHVSPVRGYRKEARLKYSKTEPK